MTAQQPDGPGDDTDGRPDPTGADDAGSATNGQPQDADVGRDADQDADHDARSPNREAAKYRTKLREVETERDALVARVERHQLADIARLVGDRLAQPNDLTAFGVTLADLLDDDGEVDPVRVDTAVADLLGARPGLAVTKERKFPDLGGGRRGASTDTGNSSWGQVIGQERVRG